MDDEPVTTIAQGDENSGADKSTGSWKRTAHIIIVRGVLVLAAFACIRVLYLFIVIVPKFEFMLSQLGDGLAFGTRVTLALSTCCVYGGIVIVPALVWALIVGLRRADRLPLYLPVLILAGLALMPDFIIATVVQGIEQVKGSIPR